MVTTESDMKTGTPPPQPFLKIFPRNLSISIHNQSHNGDNRQLDKETALHVFSAPKNYHIFENMMTLSGRSVLLKTHEADSI